jgi:hypothetical protein
MRDRSNRRYQDNMAFSGGLRPRLWLAVVGLSAGLAMHGDFVVAPVANHGVPDEVGARSSAAMIVGSDGAFYGTTQGGGGGVWGLFSS